MNTQRKEIKKIVFIDSGYGGLLTCAHIKKEFPNIETICVLDSANMPYGEKSLEELDSRYLELQKKAEEVGADLVVVACNTLSATAYLRNGSLLPTIDIISMSIDFINYLKPKEIQLVATPNTIKSKIYPMCINKSTSVLEIEAKTLASKIEEGNTKIIVQDFENLKLNKDISVFLGCTHYSALIPFLTEYNFYSQLDILTQYLKNNYILGTASVVVPHTSIIINSEYDKYSMFAMNLFPENRFEVILQEF